MVSVPFIVWATKKFTNRTVFHKKLHAGLLNMFTTVLASNFPTENAFKSVATFYNLYYFFRIRNYPSHT